MDDFNVSALHESKNEWGSRLLTILTPLIIEGLKSILNESLKLCASNKENDKYLMTFQNLLSRIPKWNQQIVQNECKRIIERSGCNYLEDLLSCVHIIQLKILTAMRVGQKQKKISLVIPKFDEFIHKVYINVARKIYKNVYLLEVNIEPLQIQKNNRELEIIIQECILNTLRENIPVEAILAAYLDENVEEDVIEEVKEEIIKEPIQTTDLSTELLTQTPSPILTDLNTNINANGVDNSTLITEPSTSIVSTNNLNIPSVKFDTKIDINDIKNEENINENNFSKLKISDEDFNLDNLDVNNLEEPKVELFPELIIDEIEVLD